MPKEWKSILSKKGVLVESNSAYPLLEKIEELDAAYDISNVKVKGRFKVRRVEPKTIVLEDSIDDLPIYVDCDRTDLTFPEKFMVAFSREFHANYTPPGENRAGIELVVGDEIEAEIAFGPSGEGELLEESSMLLRNPVTRKMFKCYTVEIRKKTSPKITTSCKLVNYGIVKEAYIRESLQI